jgi:hypothetical protein
MGRAPAKFRQVDVARAIRGAIKAGLSVSRVEIDRDGKIVVICPGVEFTNGEQPGVRL